MRETIVKCDLCLKVIEKEHIPNFKIKSKPKNGWRGDGYESNIYGSHELCKECEDAILEKILSLRQKGSVFKVRRTEIKEDEEDIA